MAEQDMRIEPVPGAPISLKKVSTITTGGLSVLLDQSGSGFINDDETLVDISIKAREEQAEYFFGLDVPFPEYLRPYLEYMYADEPDINFESLHKYGKTNGEYKHIVSIIQMVSFALKHAKAANKGVRLFLEEPETRMHPKRERRIMGLLEMLKKNYGFSEPEKEQE